MSGLFVTLEGIDRAGKSTQAALLAGALGPGVRRVREPGGTEVGERVRALVKDSAVAIGDRAEALLFAAARAELVERVIAPALAEGRTVVCDRFVDSSLAYQGEARGLGMAAIARVNAWATDGLVPNLTILLWIDPKVAAARAGEEDRIEHEGASLQARVLRGYEALAAEHPDRWRRVDADRPAEDVHRDVLAAVEPLLAGAPRVGAR